MEMPSVTFISGNIRYNTYSDWKLAIDGTPMIAIPKQKVQTVDIPGLNGVLDISNSMRIGGGPLFENREGSFVFYFLDMSFYSTNDWDEFVRQKKSTLKEIINTVHGQILNVETTDDPGVVYYGRFSVDEVDDSGSSAADKITISYSLQPDPVNIGV